MRPVALSEEIAVGAMPEPAQIAVLAKAGFRSLLSVQPDGEVARLLSSAEAAQAAAAAGLAFAHIAVTSRRIAEPQAQAFATALATLPRPIYACCYSGARSAAAWAMAVAPTKSYVEIEAACAAAGFDITALRPEIEGRRVLQAVAAADRVAPASATENAPTTRPAVAPAVPASASPDAPTVVSSQPILVAQEGIAQERVARDGPASDLAPPATTAPLAALVTAPAAASAAVNIVFPRAAGAGGFATSG